MNFLDTLTLHIAEHFADKEFCYGDLADFGPLHGKSCATVSATLRDLDQKKLIIHTKRYRISTNSRPSKIYKINPHDLTVRVEEIKAGKNNRKPRAGARAQQSEEDALRTRDAQHTTISRRITRALDAITKQRLEVV